MKKKYILALDSGTTGSRAILFDHNNKIVSDASVEFPQIYPNPGWVEHNPMDILNSQLSMAKKVLNQASVSSKEISAIGITNQRETSILWERATGKPIMNAIVWQDHRSSAICDAMKAKGLTEYVKKNTGLVIDAYFSGTKIKWMLDNISGARKKAENGDLLFGTVDTWLIWNLTGGRVHATDYSNASRTMILNIKNIDWDKTMLEELTIPEAILPKLCPSSEIYGFTDESFFDGAKIPIAAAIGDQQSALFGQACFKAGMAKATYGTGGTMMMNTGSKPIHSESGMLTSVAWGLNGKVQYSLEGMLYVIGAAVQWLRDELKLIYDSSDSDYYAQKVNDTNGVYVVPAFVGLAAPYWDQYARGAILGLTRGANRNHIIRATLESIGYQMRDVLECMEKDSGLSINELKVDGGVSKGNFTMQFQADIMGIPILRPKIIETTARGAASLAGLATGFWENQDKLLGTFNLDRVFKPTFDETKRNQLYAGWKKAIGRAKSWEEP